MVVPRIWVPIPKTRVNCPNVKKKRFFAFFGDTLQKKFKWLPNGQYWRQWGCLWLILKLMSSIFKNTCESCRNVKKFGRFAPPKSGDPESWYSKTLFLGTFFENIAILTHFDKTNPPPWYISLESCGSQLFRHKVKNNFFSTVRPSEFC